MHNLENKKDYDELFLLKYKNKKLLRLFLISVYIYCQYKKRNSFISIFFILLRLLSLL